MFVDIYSLPLVDTLVNSQIKFSSNFCKRHRKSSSRALRIQATEKNENTRRVMIYNGTLRPSGDMCRALRGGDILIGLYKKITAFLKAVIFL